MPMTLEELYTEAITLPNESKAILADRLVESIDNQVTKSQLEEVKIRRDEIRSGIISSIPGEDGLAQARAIIKR